MQVLSPQMCQCSTLPGPLEEPSALAYTLLVSIHMFLREAVALGSSSGMCCPLAHLSCKLCIKHGDCRVEMMLHLFVSDSGLSICSVLAKDFSPRLILQLLGYFGTLVIHGSTEIGIRSSSRAC